MGQILPDPRLTLSAIRARYNIPGWFHPIDPWHQFTAAEIRRHVRRFWKRLPTQPQHRILNAGAGGNDLGMCPETTISLDISEAQVLSLPTPLVANVEALPLASASIDTILCVGSVLNYCDAATAISEFARTLRSGGYLVLEFESSQSAEFLGHHVFGKSAAMIETFYGIRPEVVWVYKPKYILNLLMAAGFKLIRNIPIQVLSPWALRMSCGLPTAATIGRLDLVAKYVPLLKGWASNYLLFCER